MDFTTAGKNRATLPSEMLIHQASTTFNVNYVLNPFLSVKIQQQRTAKGSKITPTTRYNKRSKTTQQQPENEPRQNIFRNHSHEFNKTRYFTETPARFFFQFGSK